MTTPNFVTLPREVVEQYADALFEAGDLLHCASSALYKLHLDGKGSDCSLSHELRMFALHFSKEERTGPGALQINGTGRAYKAMDTTYASMKALRAALTEQVQPAERTGDCKLCGHCAATGEKVSFVEKVQPAQGAVGAKMPCGAVVTNVYDAYEAGKKAAILQPNAERVPLTVEQITLALGLVRNPWPAVIADVRAIEAAHGITKGQQ